MSSPLAVAAVTATLCDLLNNGLIDNDLAHVGSFSISAVPPDRIETGNHEGNRLNLFLYQVTANPGWRNAGLPSHDSRDAQARLTNPPLALDLHYLLTAYGSADFAAEILLGYAMELLHDARVLARDDIRRALSPTNPLNLALIPKDPQGRSSLDLADQVEQIKIVPHYLSSEELSKLWTAMQSRYRPTMAYQVSTVIIQGTRPVRSPLPVLARGENDTGVRSQPGIGAPPPSVPTVQSLTLVPAEAKAVLENAELGDLIVLDGVLLSGTKVEAELYHALLAQPKVLQVEAGNTAEKVQVRLPQSHDNAAPGFDAAASKDLPAGDYRLALRIERAGKPLVRTKPQAFSLAPRLTQPPAIAAGPKLDVSFYPEVWPAQRVELFVGAQAFPSGAHANKTAQLSIAVPALVPSEKPVPVRLRVDGVDSQLVRNRELQPPQFDPQQCVQVPA